MKESILERNLMNANNVASVLVNQEALGNMNESILKRSLMNAISVVSVLAKQDI